MKYIKKSIMKLKRLFNMKLKKGFTLVELLMVLGLMAVLILFVIPSVISFVNKRMTDVEEVENKLLLESISSYMERNPNKYEKLDGSVYCIPVTDMIEFGSLEKVFMEKSEKYSENQTMLVSISYGAVTILEVFDGECVFPLYYGPVTWTSQVGTVTAEIPAATGTTVEYRVGQNDVWGTWQASRTFAGLNPVEEYEFQANIDTVTIEDTIKSMSPKANQEIGAITEVTWTSEETSTTATVTAVTGATHYRVNSGSWQASNIFPGLAHLTEYTFRVRKAQTTTLNEVISPGFVSTSPDSTPSEIEYVNDPTEPTYPANATPCGDVGSEFTHIIDKRETDPLDHKTYAVTKIGTQCWMVDNLVYTTPECLSATWNDVEPYDACRKNGGSDWDQHEVVYQWEALMNWDGVTPKENLAGTQGLCPVGWQVPSDNEFTTLERTVCENLGNEGCETMYQYDTFTTGAANSNEGLSLKDDINWNGINADGFTGLPTGYRWTDGILSNVDSDAYYWTSTLYSGTIGSRRLYNVGPNVDRIARAWYSQSAGCSVRCILSQ